MLDASETPAGISKWIKERIHRHRGDFADLGPWKRLCASAQHLLTSLSRTDRKPEHAKLAKDYVMKLANGERALDILAIVRDKLHEENDWIHGVLVGLMSLTLKLKDMPADEATCTGFSMRLGYHIIIIIIIIIIISPPRPREQNNFVAVCGVWL